MVSHSKEFLVNKQLWLILMICFDAVVSGCSSTPKTIKRTVIIDGRSVEETRLWRDPSQPFTYDAWALKLSADWQSESSLEKASGEGVEIEAGRQKLREVSERIELLVNLKSQLSKDWNAFLLTKEEYNRRSEFIDKSFIALQLIAGSDTDPVVSLELLAQLAEWSATVYEGLNP